MQDKFEAFYEILDNMGDKFKELKKVQKQKFVQIWFLNLIITNEKQVILKPHKGLEDLFSGMGRNSDDFLNLFYTIRNNTDLKWIQSLMSFYKDHIVKDKKQFMKNLSEEDKRLYKL